MTTEQRTAFNKACAEYIGYEYITQNGAVLIPELEDDFGRTQFTEYKPSHSADDLGRVIDRLIIEGWGFEYAARGEQIDLQIMEPGEDITVDVFTINANTRHEVDVQAVAKILGVEI